MMVGQVALALSPSIGIAIAGRILVGAGDAMTFISVIRLLASWFSGRILPQLSQWTGNIGALGQVLSAVPLSWALAQRRLVDLVRHRCGAVGGGVRARVRAPGRRQRTGGGGCASVQLAFGPRPVAAKPGQTGHPTRASGRRSSRCPPGRHSACCGASPPWSAGSATARPWPPGCSRSSWGWGWSAGPILGILSARFPLRRSTLILGIVASIGVAWSAVLIWPGTPPLWLIVVLIVTMGIGGTGAMIGFDFARTFNPLRNLGSANGVVNVGGFLASFIMMFLIGVLLDVQNQLRIGQGLPDDLFSWDFLPGGVPGAICRDRHRSGLPCCRPATHPPQTP